MSQLKINGLFHLSTEARRKSTVKQNLEVSDMTPKYRVRYLSEAHAQLIGRR